MEKGQRIVYVGAEFIISTMREGSEHRFRVESGLPPDASVVRVFMKPSVGMVGEQLEVAVVVESSEWKELPEGFMIPEFQPIFNTIPID